MDDLKVLLTGRIYVSFNVTRFIPCFDDYTYPNKLPIISYFLSFIVAAVRCMAWLFVIEVTFKEISCIYSILKRNYGRYEIQANL